MSKWILTNPLGSEPDHSSLWGISWSQDMQTIPEDPMSQDGEGNTHEPSIIPNRASAPIFLHLHVELEKI